jgi:hypothetical protein
MGGGAHVVGRNHNDECPDSVHANIRVFWQVENLRKSGFELLGLGKVSFAN